MSFFFIWEVTGEIDTVNRTIKQVVCDYKKWDKQWVDEIKTI